MGHKPVTYKEQNPWMYVSVLLAVLLIVMVFLQYKTFTGTAFAGNAVLDSNSAPQVQAQPSQPSQEQAPLNIQFSEDHVKGASDAPITMVEFSDFECPFCGRAFPTVKKVLNDYNNVRFVYKQFPLPFHSEAMSAALASECASEQGKFWEYHDALFENQASLGTEFYVKTAADLGLDMNRFNSCLGSEKYRNKINKDISEAKNAGVSGTPTFFINGQKLVGAQPYQAFAQLINSLQ